MARVNDDLWLNTTLIRQDNDGQPVECDVAVNFSVIMTHQGHSATWMEPGEASEFEIEFIGAELDGEPSDAPGPLTAIEVGTLRKWFNENEARAWECANDNLDI